MTKRKPKSQHLPVGRPPKFDESVVSKLEYAFSIDCNVSEACFHAGISRDTYYTRIKANKKLSDRFEALKERPVFLAREEVVKGFKNNPELALKYLERKRKAEFSTRSETSGPDGKDLNVTITAEQIQRIASNILGKQ